MKIATNSVVSIHYTLTDDQGAVIDSSVGSDPLVYLHGSRAIIPGLERALEGREPGETLKVSVPPEEGYGPSHPELIQTVPHSAFQGVERVETGMQFQAHGEDGSVRRVRIVQVSDEGVTVDGNHPLAGAVLHFDVEVSAVRAATPEEIAHGHVH